MKLSRNRRAADRAADQREHAAEVDADRAAGGFPPLLCWPDSALASANPLPPESDMIAALARLFDLSEDHTVLAARASAKANGTTISRALESGYLRYCA
jgi:hypothetical protein